MGAVWLTSRSLRLATSGKTLAFCISFVQSPFLYYKQKAHKEVGWHVETATFSIQNQKRNQKTKKPFRKLL